MARARFAPVALVTTLLAVLGVVGGPAASACACGGFVAADGEQVAASAEYAALTWDGETERVLLSMEALTEADEAALILPTPAPADVQLADERVFTELETLMAPEHTVEYRWWPEMGAPATGGTDGTVPGASPTVSVLDSRQLGPLEVTVLSANDADSLASWLDDHDYVMRDGLADALMPYVADGWFYVAVRMTTEATDLSGALQPLDITFASDRLIYPMRLSAAAPQSQFVRTFVFGAHRMERTDTTASSGRVQLRFAGEVATTAVTSDALVEIAATAPYLTVTDQYFDDPGSQVMSDFTFAQAASDTPYRETTSEIRMREIAGLPAGPVLVLLAMVTVLAGALVAGLLRRRRRRPHVTPTAP